MSASRHASPTLPSLLPGSRQHVLLRRCHACCAVLCVVSVFVSGRRQVHAWAVPVPVLVLVLVPVRALAPLQRAACESPAGVPVWPCSDY